MSDPVCIVTGVGPGTGSALVRRFARDYPVAMISRDADRLSALADTVANTYAYPADVTDFDAITDIVGRVRADLGRPAILIHNAVRGTAGEVLDMKPEDLEVNFQINVQSLLHLIQQVGPDMVQAGQGVIMATGNTAAYRGKAFFAGFAPTKAAQRILLEAAARSLGPKGVHVGYVAIDAVIDLPWTRERFAGKPDDFFCQPDDIAENCYLMAHQPKSAWTFDMVIRPFGETW